jgi:hypothetical protein
MKEEQMDYKVTVESESKIFWDKIPVSSASEVSEFIDRAALQGAGVARDIMEGDMRKAAWMLYEKDAPRDSGEFRFFVSESMFEIVVDMIKLEIESMAERAS